MATKWKSIISFTAFFLGITLLLSGIIDSVYLLSSRSSWKAQITEAFEEDYQNTGEFRWQMAVTWKIFWRCLPAGSSRGNGYRAYNYYSGADTYYEDIAQAYAVESGTGDWSWSLSEDYPNEVTEAIGDYSSDYDDYDGYDKELSGYKEREKALSDLFASNPQSAAFLTDWRKGEDPIIGMVRKFGDDFKAALEDPEKQEALAAANKEFAERIAQEKEYEGEYQKNSTKP